MSVRNAGSGIAVLHGWYLYPEQETSDQPAPLESFIRLTRDIFVRAGDIGFWQGVFRDPSAPEFADGSEAIRERRTLMIEVLYGDHEGGQRSITRFGLVPRDDGDWIVAAARHWNVDRDDPR